MVCRFIKDDFDLILYYIKVENNQHLMRMAVEEAFKRARIRWEEENYADYFLNYLDNELDELNIEYKIVDEFTIEW